MLKTVTALVTDITHQVRLAGLGVMSKAQQIGTEVLESLIEEGEKVQARDNPRLVANKSSGGEPAKVPMGDNLADLEKIFQDRVARSLKQLDVPSQDDLRLINQKMEILNKSIKTIAEQQKVGDEV
jgi:poly(hydroxyalkanoate) granule-associated protein